jgi:hypothetical protein
VSLFESEYQVLSPLLAAHLATAMELEVRCWCSLAWHPARDPGAAGMVAIIQLFVYPEAWPTQSNGYLHAAGGTRPRAGIADALLARWPVCLGQSELA